MFVSRQLHLTTKGVKFLHRKHRVCDSASCESSILQLFPDGKQKKKNGNISHGQNNYSLPSNCETLNLSKTDFQLLFDVSVQPQALECLDIQSQRAEKNIVSNAWVIRSNIFFNVPFISFYTFVPVSFCKAKTGPIASLLVHFLLPGVTVLKTAGILKDI